MKKKKIVYRFNHSLLLTNNDYKGYIKKEQQIKPRKCEKNKE